jgi:hypothetical protein
MSEKLGFKLEFLLEKPWCLVLFDIFCLANLFSFHCKFGNILEGIQRGE